MNILRGRTSQIISLQANDTSSFNGGGKTGLAFNTAGLIAYFKRELATSAVAISLATTTVGVWASGGFVEIDATHLPGSYELSIPNLAIGTADASTWVEIYLSGAVGAYFQPMRLDLVAYDAQDAVHYGLGALPNANAAASGGLLVVGSGAGGINVDGSGRVPANVQQWLAATVNALISGRVDGSVGAYQTGLAPLQPTVAARTLDVSATGEAGVDWANIGSPTTTVDLSGTTVKNVDNAIARVTLVDTTTVATTATNLTNAPTAGDFTSTMKSSLNAATPASVVGAVGSVTNPVTLTGAYDAAKVASSQTSVNTVITNQGTINTNVLAVPAAVWDVGTRTLTSFGTLVSDIVTAVWAVVLSGSNTAAQLLIAAAAGGGGGGATPAQIWAYAISLLTDPSTIGGYIKSQLAAIYAKQTATNGVVLIDGFSPDTKTLKLTQYATHLAADNNALSLTVYVPVDPTDGIPILTLKLSNTATNHAGTLTNYDPTTQLATLSFELTAAHVTPSALPSGGQFSLGVVLIDGTLIPISYPRGKVIVDPAGDPAAAVAP